MRVACEFCNSIANAEIALTLGWKKMKFGESDYLVCNQCAYKIFEFLNYLHEEVES